MRSVIRACWIRLTDGRRAQAISGRIDYSFADEALLHRALRHASLDVEDDNEHLEFLGDRVLGLVIAEELLARYPQEKEGDLARRQAELVSRRICAEIAAEVNLDAVIRCDPGQRGGGDAPARNILANGCEAVLGAVYLDGGLQVCCKGHTGFVARALMRKPRHRSMPKPNCKNGP